MAYGVKYRLEFSDVLGYGKKVEILKKDYTGEILPMIGGAEPVVIKWNSSDDFYKPLIGSSCKLNLLVTDEIQYDDFYRFDEREYKIKVSYSKSISETFSDRVVADGGIYESLECIDSFLGDFYTTSTYYNERVNNDNGRVESLGCVSSTITDEKVNIWADYWIGYLVVDRYKEQMSSFPFSISLNAFDGLGTLDNYVAPISADDDILSGNSTSDIERISKILQNLDLDLDIIFINDLKFKQTIDSVVTYVKYPNVTSFSNYIFELTNGFDLYKAKNQLSLLLSNYNMRIFQSYGKWYVVENSNVFDNSVKENIISLNTSLNPPLNIRELITTRLKSINNEFLNSQRFNYLGVSQGIENISTLKIAPKQLKPINNDLKREYLQPIYEVERQLNTTQFGKTFWNNNSGFEYGLFNWDVNGTYAVLAENTISKQGGNSIYLNAPTTGDVKCITTERLSQGLQGFEEGRQIDGTALGLCNYSFNYLVESNDLLIGTYIQYVIKFTSTAGQIIYWNNVLSEWQTTSYLNQIPVSSFNTWLSITSTFKSIPYSDYLFSFGFLDLEIHNTITSASTLSDYEKTYFDNVGIYQNLDSFKWSPNMANVSNSPSKNIKATRLIDLNYSSKKTIKAINFPNVSPAMSNKSYRSRDVNFINGNTTKLNTVSNIQNQNIMNDFRDFCIRYEGSFRGLNPTPLSLHNKIWFDWVGVLEDEQSSIIDGLTYAVKSNNYKVLAHVPNDDNDLDISVQITD